MKPHWSPIVLIVLLFGCVFDSSEGALANRSGEGEDGYDSDDCKIEGEDIGGDGVVVLLGDKEVTFDSWVPKADSPGEYVGFTITVSGADSVGYVVKAGGELYPDNVTFWSHPNGDEGSEASGISNVDFCEECDDGSCDGGGDDGDGDDGGGDGDDGGTTPPVE